MPFIVLRTGDGFEEQLFPSLRYGLKTALEELRRPAAKPSGELRPVAIVPLIDLLRRAAQKQQGPLNERDVIRVRDGAIFVLLSRAVAERIAARRDTHLDPANLWTEWQKWSAAPRSP